MASGLFGIGGGLVIVPLLVIGLKLSQHRAHAISLGAVIFIALAAAIPFALTGNVSVTLAGWMALSAMASARYGAILMRRLSENQLKVLFGALVLIVAARMALGVEPSAGGNVTNPITIMVVGLAIGVVSGFASSVLGIGGGLVMVPAMVFFLGMPQHLAEGTSLVAIVPTAAAGTWVHRESGFLNARLVVAIAAGGIVAGIAGSLLALTFSGILLQRGMAVLLVFAFVRMITPVLWRSREAARPSVATSDRRQSVRD